MGKKSRRVEWKGEGLEDWVVGGGVEDALEYKKKGDKNKSEND